MVIQSPYLVTTMQVITILSDLGTQDTYVSHIKVMLARHRYFSDIVDISHAVNRGDIQHGAYLTLSTYKYFPAGTIHLLLAGAFPNNRQKLILALHGGHYFLAPDNGLLPLIFGEQQPTTLLCHEFNATTGLQEWMGQVTKAISLLDSGAAPESKYPAHVPHRALMATAPIMFNNRVDCSILHIDRYGNIVININKEQFDSLTADRKFSIKLLGIKDEVGTVSQHYNDVAEGRLLCRFNSAGFLEIAINQSPGNAMKPSPMPERSINYDKISINLLS